MYMFVLDIGLQSLQQQWFCPLEYDDDDDDNNDNNDNNNNDNTDNISLARLDNECNDTNSHKSDNNDIVSDNNLNCNSIEVNILIHFIETLLFINSNDCFIYLFSELGITNQTISKLNSYELSQFIFLKLCCDL